VDRGRAIDRAIDPPDADPEPADRYKGCDAVDQEAMPDRAVDHEHCRYREHRRDDQRLERGHRTAANERAAHDHARHWLGRARIKRRQLIGHQNAWPSAT
jgi:hypothetical protein